jgi:PAS domain S-box-containing protein
MSYINFLPYISVIIPNRSTFGGDKLNLKPSSIRLGGHSAKHDRAKTIDTSAMSKPVKILVVEDSESDTKMIVRALRRGGFDPAHKRVQDAAALEATLGQEHWDAVVSDLKMPGFSGADALSILQSAGLDIPFILISGAVGEEVAVEAMKSGASDYVMKNNIARLAPALERQLADAAVRAAHRQTQRELVESEDRFRRLTALSSDWYWELDENLAFVRISEGFADKLAGDGAPSIGKAFWDLNHLECDWAMFYAVLERREPFRDFEVRQMRTDGTVLHLSLSGEPMFGPAGDFCGYHGVGTDISARKRGEAKLHQAATVFTSTHEGVVVADLTRHITAVNPAFCTITGYTEDMPVPLVPAQ